jgi:segregation and condensation protein B
MSRQPPSTPEPDRQGISLEELANAFAQVMGKTPRSRPENEGEEEPLPEEREAEKEAIETSNVKAPNAAVEEKSLSEKEDRCPISPKSLFEAMLFVGNRENRPLAAAKAAELMRDVSPEEIPEIVDELNAAYQAGGRPYCIIGEGEGYRLALNKEFYPVRNKLYGRLREARLSQAAIDVLALVAYKQPLTGEQVGKMRGKPSSHILTQLVRRGLLRLNRPAEKPRVPHYFVTDRFLRLFNLESLDDLPRSEEPG